MTKDKRIKKLCADYNKSEEDWEDYFPREIKKLLDNQRKELVEEIEKLITEEILECHHSNTPTSRLTSLMMNIKKLK
jgi:hypothetical protein